VLVDLPERQFLAEPVALPFVARRVDALREQERLVQSRGCGEPAAPLTICRPTDPSNSDKRQCRTYGRACNPRSRKPKWRSMLTHSERRLSDPWPDGWVIYLSHQPPRRLVVFVHGFMGGPLKTWRSFEEAGSHSDWWRAADMLFMDYRSVSENITAVARRLRIQLPKFYPFCPDDLTHVNGIALRESAGPYTELILVGHSLGGVVLRRALSDAAQQWIEDRSKPRPVILDGVVRLFSPASAGFSTAGFYALAQAIPTLWLFVNAALRMASSFTDLQPNSPILTDTRRRTESFVAAYPEDLRQLRAKILWANPENLVYTERYDTDPVDDAEDGLGHRGICKPSPSFTRPWDFVEKGA
jgi:alpha-beta hydrolase superfamily lysophospholipase